MKWYGNDRLCKNLGLHAEQPEVEDYSPFRQRCEVCGMLMSKGRHGKRCKKCASINKKEWGN